MNTWGYLILIAALLMLSAYMLYARFAARSREKSLHHAPCDSVTFQFAPRPEISESSAEDEGERPIMDLKPLVEETTADSDEDREKKEDSYFDELQEAAAGLAMLMRSSPTQSRSEPVVFAPDTEDEAGAEKEEEEVSVGEKSVSDEPPGDEVDDRVDAPETSDLVSTNVEGNQSAEAGDSVVELEANEETASTDGSSIEDAMEKVEAILNESPVFERENDLSAESNLEEQGETSLEALLGEEVASRFSKLDDGLDELELLVVDIEEQLLRFDEFVSSPVEEVIEEAA